MISNPALNATTTFTYWSGNSGSTRGGGSESKLKSAAIRGAISAGISVFILLVVSVVLLCWRMRKKRQQQMANQGTEQMSAVVPTSFGESAQVEHNAGSSASADHNERIRNLEMRVTALQAEVAAERLKAGTQ